MHDAIFQVMNGFIIIFVIVVCPTIIKYVKVLNERAKSLIGVDKLEQAKQFAQIVVNAISQKYGKLSNEEKFAKAVYFIEQKFGKTLFSEEEIELLIESAVKELKTLSK